MIGVDWGTSNFRAFRLGRDGAILARLSAPRGILQVTDGQFAAALSEAIGSWLEAGEDRILLCGMIGSRQGWREAAYVPCPAGIAELAEGIAAVPFEGASVRLVPGVSTVDPEGVPDVIRGEETKIVGMAAALDEGGLVCLPGTHSKWVSVRNRRIAGFTTHMTGEVFGVLRRHSILGRMMRDAPIDWAEFDLALARAGQAGGWLHHLFGVRTLGLAGRLADTSAASYLSGLLIGHEVRAALRPGAVVYLLGDSALTVQYGRAIAALGGTLRMASEDAAAHGLAAIGAGIDWSAGSG